GGGGQGGGARELVVCRIRLVFRPYYDRDLTFRLPDLRAHLAGRAADDLLMPLCQLASQRDWSVAQNITSVSKRHGNSVRAFKEAHRVRNGENLRKPAFSGF